MKLQRIQEWQLYRAYEHLERLKISGLRLMAFKIHEGGISTLEVHYNRIREVKTLSAKDLQWYGDTWFRTPHIAVQVPFKDNVVLVGFWAYDYEGLKKALKEILPDEQNGSFDPSWGGTGEIFLEDDPTS